METTKQTMQKKTQVLASDDLPAVESIQKEMQLTVHANNDRSADNSEHLPLLVFAKGSRSQSAYSHNAVKTELYPCKWESSTRYEDKQGKRDSILTDLRSSLYNGFIKSIPPDGTSSHNNDTFDATPDVEPIPLSCDFPIVDNEEDLNAAILSLCRSMEGGDARSSLSSSFNFDATSSELFLNFTEEGGGEEDSVASIDWVF